MCSDGGGCMSYVTPWDEEDEPSNMKERDTDFRGAAESISTYGTTRPMITTTFTLAG